MQRNFHLTFCSLACSVLMVAGNCYAIDRCTPQVVPIKQGLSSYGRNVEKLLSAARDYDKAVTKLINKQSAAVKEILEIEDGVEKASMALDDAKEQLNFIQSQIGVMKVFQLPKAEGELAAAHAEYDMKCVVTQTPGFTCIGLQGKIQNFTIKLNVLNGTIANLMNQLSAMQAAVDAAQSELDKKEDEAGRARFERAADLKFLDAFSSAKLALNRLRAAFHGALTQASLAQENQNTAMKTAHGCIMQRPGL